MSKKPEYSIPSMAEITKVKATNGMKVISTFSGCGGSCLGFEMAGFEVLWASEFISSAREVYELNHPGVTVDSRDIREVSPGDVLDAAGVECGEVDVLEGSPPCASFSTAGRRSTHWGKVKSYSESKQRTDDLFFEFARILRGVMPRAFVAENVSGLVKGVAKGYFKEILSALKGCGYKVAAKVLDAQWLGVPQTRQRLIFVGVREDLGKEPVHPKPLPYRYSVTDACPWIMRGVVDTGGLFPVQEFGPRPCPMIRATPTESKHYKVTKECSIEGTAIGKEYDELEEGEQSEKFFNLIKLDPSKPSPCICQSHGNRGTAGPVLSTEKRKFTIGELKRICGFPDDFQLTGSYSQQWERLGRAVPPPMMRAVAEVLRDEVLT